MAQDVNISKAWDFYVSNPAIIYLFSVSKKIPSEKLVEILQRAPVNLTKEDAEKRAAAIKENPLFNKTEDGLEINTNVAKRLVGAVGNSFGLKKDTSKDEKIQRLKKELAETKSQLEELKKQSISKDIVVSDICPLNNDGEEISVNYTNSPIESISSKPYVNGFKAPSIYDTSSKSNDIADTKKSYTNNLKFINEALEMVKAMLGKTKKEKIDQRKLLIKELTDETNSRFAKRSAMQKLIYYLSFYPDITEKQKKNILDACKNGLDAQVILDLMETDEDLFSVEYFSYMVDLARENAEPRMMIDLSKKLMLGEWYVSAKVDGVPQKFMLRPVVTKEVG